MEIKSLVPGSILSENSFFTVKVVKPESVVVVDDYGNDLEISKDYVENILQSADYYSSEEKKTMTELADLFIRSPRVAMTVAFYKKDTNKTKKAFEAEKSEKIEEIRNAKVSDVEKLLSDLIENPISKVIPGELRVMKGRHYGDVDDLGRVHFLDMEIDKDSERAATDGRMRQVDPRTIQYIIVHKVKYSLKK